MILDRSRDVELKILRLNGLWDHRLLEIEPRSGDLGVRFEIFGYCACSRLLGLRNRRKMDSLEVIGAMVIVNSVITFVMLLIYAIVRHRPSYERFYFPKLHGIRNSPESSSAPARRSYSLDFRTYFRFLNWMPDNNFADHGLDSAAHTQIYLIGFKIFAPLTVLCNSILLPINWMAQPLESRKDFTSSNIDNLSMSNVPSGSEW
ncbi:hypothetical protein L1049_016957 [Liquidambar formosana]|uniref:CSC1/OSCA1-like N-terminal transmembrane domain-containing protein n=1 Tax=Liquidambar formosana TaxID=63359 RepID=A0AAP0S069_LIQFO